MKQAPKGGWRLKEHSSHRLILRFHDGQVRTFYSMDWQHSTAAYDMRLGLFRLASIYRQYREQVVWSGIFRL